MRWILFCLLASVAHGVAVTSFSAATDLVGTTVSVKVFGGSSGGPVATFVARGDGSVIASSFGTFDLVVSAGDTFTSTWTLTNKNSPSAPRFTQVFIDLLGSGKAVFDNGSTPSTPGSSSGILGVTGTGGIGILSSTEVNLWGDPVNTGDLYTAVSITFAGGFTTGAVSTWQDDTDNIVIPEPGTLLLAGTAMLSMLGLRRPKPQGKVTHNDPAL